MVRELIELCGRDRFIPCTTAINAAAELCEERTGARSDVLAAAFHELELARVYGIVTDPGKVGIWLRSVLSAYRPLRERWQPLVRVVGGESAPAFSVRPPCWHSQEFWPMARTSVNAPLAHGWVAFSSERKIVTVGHLWVIREVLTTSRTHLIPSVSSLFEEFAK